MRQIPLSLAWRRRLYHMGVPIVIGLFAGWVADGLLNEVPWLNELEVKLQQEGSRSLDTGLLKSDIETIVHVTISSETRTQLAGRTDAPIPRKHYGTLLKKLAQSKARGILFTVYLANANEENLEIERALDEVGSMPVYLAALHEKSPSYDDPSEPDGKRFEFEQFDYFKQHDSSLNIRRVYPLGFTESAIGQLFMKWDDIGKEWLPGSGLAVALMISQIPQDSIDWKEGKEVIYARGHRWILDSNRTLRINYPEEFPAFTEIDLADAVKMDDKAALAAFEGKVIVLGESFDSGANLFTEIGELSASEWTSLMALSYLRPSRFFMHTHEIIIYFVAFGVVAAALGLRPRSIVVWVGIMGLALLAFAIPRTPGLSNNYVIETVGSILATCVAFGVGLGVSILTPEPRRRPGEVLTGTAVFIDLEHSTVLLEKVGQEAYRSFFAKWCQEMSKFAARFDGAVERTTGDGAFLMFSSPKEFQDVFNALDFADAFIAYTQTLKVAVDEQVRCRVGLERGDTTGDYVVEAGRKVWSSSGPSVNFARRVADVATEEFEPVRIGPVAAKIANLCRSIRPIGLYILKGFEGEREVFSVDRSNRI